MSAVCFEKQGGYAMGAPEYLLPENHPVLKQVETYSKEGLRVLLLVQTDLVDEQTSQIGQVVPVALVLIHDCIRQEARETLAFFEKSGVEMRILSGDNPMTVSRVACLAGLSCLWACKT